MSDQVFIYLIVALNTLVQLMLIGRLNFPAGGKRKYYVFAVAIPVLVMLSTRLLITGGMIHNRVADQSAIEQHVTTAASVLLMAGPWLVTLAAILDKQRKGWLVKTRRRTPP
ncbi:MAG: hypothetical protein ACXWCY_15070 [Burkholderiales bacterium]